MANERFTDLPTVPSATSADIICAVQNNTSVQETLAQVMTLFSGSFFLNFAGNPNGHVAGTQYNTFCWDSVDHIWYICTTTGTSLTAVWTATGMTGSITPAQGGTGVSNPTAHGVAIGEGASNFNFLTLGNGQLLIGVSGADPAIANLTAGTGINIVNAAGSITISATGAGGFTWNHVTGTSQTMIANNGYITDNPALVSLTLPVTSSVGDEIKIVGLGAGGWTIVQSAGQNIQVGSSSTTVGVGGSLSSSNRYDSINLVCTVANNTWSVSGGPEGNLTIV